MWGISEEPTLSLFSSRILISQIACRTLWLTRKLESMVLISWAHLDKNVSWLAKQRTNKLTHQSWQIMTLEFRTHFAIVTVLIIPFPTDKGNLKNLQFWPESLGAMLEYWYFERGLFHSLVQIFPIQPISSFTRWSWPFSFSNNGSWCT